MTVTIAGTDRTRLVDYASLRIAQQIGNRPDEAEFEIRKFGSRTYTPAVDEEVIIRDNDGTTKIFAGVIMEVEEKYDKIDYVGYRVRCVDYTRHLDKRLVIETFEDTDVLTIISFLKTNYFPSDVTITNVTGNADIDKIAFNYEYPSDCLRQLAEIANCDWYIDYDKDIHFFAKSSVAAAFDITDSNGKYVYDSLKIRKDLSQLRNTIIVRGGEFLANTTTAAFIADGAQRDFFLPYKFSNLTLTVTGQQKNVGVDPIDLETNFDALHNFQEKLIRFREDKKPTINSQVRIGGNPNLPVIVKLRDPASVDSFSAREYLIIDKSIKSKEAARDRATAELLGYKTTISEGQFETYTSGLRVGTKINVQSTIRGLNTDYIINKVDAKIFATDAATNNVQLVYKVSLISTWSYDYINLLQSFLNQKKKEIQIGSDEILDEVEGILETITLSDVFTSMIGANQQMTETITLNEVFTAQGLDYASEFVLGPWSRIEGGYDHASLRNRWKLDDKAANTTVDDAKDNNDGVASENTENLYSEANHGVGFAFNGTDRSFTVAGLTVSLPFTISFWFKFNSFTTNDRLVDQQDSGPQNGFTCLLTSAPRLQFLIRNGSTIEAQLNSGNLVAGTWYHITVVGASNDARIYQNGSLLSSDATVVMGAPSATFTVGKRAGAATNFFNGVMDDLRHYNVALTDAEVLALYATKKRQFILDGSPLG